MAAAAVWVALGTSLHSTLAIIFNLNHVLFILLFVPFCSEEDFSLLESQAPG